MKHRPSQRAPLLTRALLTLGISVCAGAGYLVAGENGAEPSAVSARSAERTALAAATVVKSRTDRTNSPITGPAHAFPRPALADDRISQESVQHRAPMPVPNAGRPEIEDPRVAAELRGENASELLDPDEVVAPDSDNVHMAPDDEWADQILAGHTQPDLDETRPYGYDDPMPIDDNIESSIADEYVDQIDSESLNQAAERAGYGDDREDWVVLEDVDPMSHPPVESGIGVAPPAGES